MTFHEVLYLGISPEGVERNYNNANYRGGLGALIEERLFDYKANNDQDPDFPEASVELKASCMDMKKDSDYSGGESLVLAMIPLDCQSRMTSSLRMCGAGARRLSRS